MCQTPRCRDKMGAVVSGGVGAASSNHSLLPSPAGTPDPCCSSEGLVTSAALPDHRTHCSAVRTSWSTWQCLQDRSFRNSPYWWAPGRRSLSPLGGGFSVQVCLWNLPYLREGDRVWTSWVGRGSEGSRVWRCGLEFQLWSIHPNCVHLSWTHTFPGPRVQGERRYYSPSCRVSGMLWRKSIQRAWACGSADKRFDMLVVVPLTTSSKEFAWLFCSCFTPDFPKPLQLGPHGITLGCIVLVCLILPHSHCSPHSDLLRGVENTAHWGPWNIVT